MYNKSDVIKSVVENFNSLPEELKYYLISKAFNDEDLSFTISNNPYFDSYQIT